MGARMGARLYAVAWFCSGAVFVLYAVDRLQASPRGLESSQSNLAMRAVSSASRRPRVVASFTTFPIGQRMQYASRVLESMANQSWQPDSVIINFPDRIERLSSSRLEIPSEAYEWQRKYSFLKIHQTKDYGPATKLLGALEVESDPDTIIVIIDDDTYYHQDTVLALVSTMLASPRDISPCFMCEQVTKTLWGTTQWGYASEEGECHGFSNGYASYAVRPRYFDQSLWNFSLGPSGCRLHDDVWISGRMLVGTGVRPYLVRPGFFSVASEFIEECGNRQAESVHVANRAAAQLGQDPQGDCVTSHPFMADATDLEFGWPFVYWLQSVCALWLRGSSVEAQVSS